MTIMKGRGFRPKATNSTQFFDFIKDNFLKLSNTDLQKINQTYPKDAFGTFPMHADYFAATETAYGESMFICPGIEVSNSLTKYKTASHVWNYRYNCPIEINVDKSFGVPHASEKLPPWALAIVDPVALRAAIEHTTPRLCRYSCITGLVSLKRWILMSTIMRKAPEWCTWSNGDSCLQRLRFVVNDNVIEDVPAP
jgi:hypothetical protein